MTSEATPPKAFSRFIERFPGLAKSWDLIHEQGGEGPLDAKTARLVKLAISMGALREGPVHAGTRKALRMGVTREELEQVVSLAAGTMGMPATVALFSWINDVLDVEDPQ